MGVDFFVENLALEEARKFARSFGEKDEERDVDERLRSERYGCVHILIWKGENRAAVVLEVAPYSMIADLERSMLSYIFKHPDEPEVKFIKRECEKLRGKPSGARACISLFRDTLAALRDLPPGFKVRVYGGGGFTVSRVADVLITFDGELTTRQERVYSRFLWRVAAETSDKLHAVILGRMAKFFETAAAMKYPVISS